MPNAKANLLLRNDTILGVCEAIGNDFGFHPNWLRLLLAGAFYWAPLAVIGTYLAMGAVVAFTRWISPDKVETAAPLLTALPTTRAVVEEQPVALAA